MTKEETIQKLRHFCAYQERCHSEVVNKLYTLEVRSREHDEIISRLIEENYLNEERFAIAFAGGKWRTKKWGRVKIKHELKRRGISEYCIKKAIKEIGQEEYYTSLKKQLIEKYNSLKKLQYLARKKRTTDYLVARGYEVSLISEIFRDTMNY